MTTPDDTVTITVFRRADIEDAFGPRYYAYLGEVTKRPGGLTQYGATSTKLLATAYTPAGARRRALRALRRTAREARDRNPVSVTTHPNPAADPTHD